MQVLLIVLAVIGLSVLASSQLLSQAGRYFQVAQLFASGLIFVVLGALCGPGGLELLAQPAIVALEPLIALGLGVAGVLMGINLEPALLRALHPKIFVGVLLQSGTAFAAVALPLVFPIWMATGLSARGAVGAAIVLGAVASVSSAHLAVIWYRAGRLDRTRSLSLTLLGMLDDLVALLLLAAALVLGAAESPLTGLGLVSLALLIGLLCGALLEFLLRATTGASERSAVLLGAVALVAGAAAYLKVSTLLAGLACGATFSLLGGQHLKEAYRSLARVERPVFLVLAFLVGAHADVREWQAWMLLPAFLSLRFLGKIVGGRITRKLTADVLPLPADPGFALLAQGGVSLCVAIEFLILVPRPSSHIVFNVAVFAAVLNEMLASRSFWRTLVSREPELPPRMEKAA